MFRSIFDHLQGDIFCSFFTTVTEDKLVGFVVACLLYLLCFVLLLLRALPSPVVAVQPQPDYGEHTTSTQSTTSITGMLPQTR